LPVTRDNLFWRVASTPREAAVRWFKVAAIAIGVMIAFLVVSSVIGFLVEALIAVLAVAVIALAVKVAFNRKQISRTRPSGEIRGPRYSRPLRRHDTADVDDELARLKREAGG
jgi:uncharacterized membrane protein YfcA